MDTILYTNAPTTGREYRINDAVGVQWFSHYGPDGSGFGYLTWRVRRRVGFQYADIGYGFRARAYKGPFRCLFDGQITRIMERTGVEGDEIELWALGWVHVAQADTFNHAYIDGRYTEWQGAEEPDGGSFCPQKFSTDTADRLLLKPRQGETDNGDFVSTNDYTYLRYTFSFGETAARFVADYAVALPGSFPATAQVLSGETVLWESSATEEGSLDLTATAGQTTFEVRLAMTATGNVSAEDGTVYALFENVRVYSENVSVLDQKVIAEDVVALLSAAGHGLSAATRRLASPGFPLTQAVFDTDLTAHDALVWACQFGDSDGNPVAWGVGLDEQRMLFLESQDLETVRYVVYPHDADSLERAGDWSESAQAAYGVYADADGQTQRTATYVSAAGMAAVGGYYRREAVSLSGVVDPTLAAALVQVRLAEHGKPQPSGTYTVRRVYTPDGRPVAFDEVLPGGLVQVVEFRALEVEASPADLRDRATTFMLAGVRVDYDQGFVELMVDTESDGFVRQMAVVEQLAGW